MSGDGRRLIVIDPGHGGQDPGAVGADGVREADVTLVLARLLADRLATEYRVAMTRTSDETVSLQQRCVIANGVRADLFVSIHCNAAANVLAQGTETYYASVRSEPLARAIHTRLVSLGLRDRGVKRDTFFVLKRTTMPAVLVEVAFISNPDDEARLESADWRQRAADAIAEAVKEYMKGRLKP